MRLKQFSGFLATPPLWLNEQFTVQQFRFPEIDLNEFPLKPIPTNIRLGHQMEHVCRQLLEHCPDYEVLLHNLPIKSGKRTIGEIDFIVKELSSGQIIHVELTYKFYIINPEISEPIHQLMGPNKRDMFFTKMEKIKNEQFKLLHLPAGIAALSDKGIDHSKITHQTCYKAQLFEPYRGTKTNVRPLNIHCKAGYWLRFDEFEHKKFKSYQFYIPSKSEWVIAPHNMVKWRSHFETLLDLNLRMLKESAPMIWMQKSTTEFEKFFVVWWE